MNTYLLCYILGVLSPVVVFILLASWAYYHDKRNARRKVEEMKFMKHYEAEYDAFTPDRKAATCAKYSPWANARFEYAYERTIDRMKTL